MRRSLLISALLVLGLAGEARACSCVGAASGFPQAEGAFVGTVVERRGARERLTYTFAVEQVYKGSFGRRASFASNASEASCGMDVPVGHRTGVVIFGDETSIGICNLIEPEELDALAEPVVPRAQPRGLIRELLTACRGALRGVYFTFRALGRI